MGRAAPIVCQMSATVTPWAPAFQTAAMISYWAAVRFPLGAGMADGLLGIDDTCRQHITDDKCCQAQTGVGYGRVVGDRWNAASQAELVTAAQGCCLSRCPNQIQGNPNTVFRQSAICCIAT